MEESRRKARVAILYSILNSTGSQWRSNKTGVTWYFSISGKQVLQRSSGFSGGEGARSSYGKPARTELQSSRWLRIRDETHWTVAVRVRNDLTEAIFSQLKVSSVANIGDVIHRRMYTDIFDGIVNWILFWPAVKQVSLVRAKVCNEVEQNTTVLPSFDLSLLLNIQFFIYERHSSMFLRTVGRSLGSAEFSSWVSSAYLW